MSRYSRFVFLSGVILFVLLASLAHPMAVYADDGAPPPPATEEPVQPPPAEEGGTEVPPLVTEEVVSPPTAEPTEEPAVTEEVEAVATEVPVTDNEEPAAVDEVPVAEILEAAPEGTEVVVLNADGSAEPLATESAAEIIQGSDPMWCPNDQLPGTTGCTDSYDTVADLINALTGKTGAGTIYFTPTYSTNDATFEYPILSGLTHLTIQGGWNGNLSGAGYALSGVTTFTVPLTVRSWVGNVTINDITIYGTTFTGLTVYTEGDINLDRVTSINNDGNGAYLNGRGDVSIDNSSFDSNTSGGNDVGLEVRSPGTVSLNNVSASNNLAGDGADILNFSELTVTGSTFNNNASTIQWDGWGLYAYTTAEDATVNIGDPEVSDPSTFNNNSRYGIYIEGNHITDITLNQVIANGNGDSGAYLYNGSGSVSVINSYFDGNLADATPSALEDATPSALYIYSDGDVFLSDVSASNNLAGNGAEISAFSSLTIENSVFNNNYSEETDGDFGYGWGLWVDEGAGDVTLTNVTASGNRNGNPGFYAGGAFIDTSGAIIIDPSEFNDNTSGAGLVLWTSETITLTDVTANGNGEDGAWLWSDGDATIVCSEFKNNDGLGVDALGVWGTFTLNDVTFSDNDGDYDYDGTPVILSGGCKVVVAGKGAGAKSSSHSLQFHIVPVSGGEQIELDCKAYSGTKLILPNGDRVTLPCPIHDTGILTGKTADQLPAPLNAPFDFASALEVQVIRNGEALSRVNIGMTIDFTIPDGQQGANFTILRWDAEASQWVEVSGGTQTGDGHFVATSNFTGIYVLVTK